MLEVYPETFALLNSEAFAHVLGTLDFGLHHQVIFVMRFFFNNQYYRMKQFETKLIKLQ